MLQFYKPSSFYFCLIIYLLFFSNLGLTATSTTNKKTYQLAVFNNSQTFNQRILAATITQLKQHFPAIEFKIKSYNSFSSIKQAVDQNKIDFIIIDAINFLRLKQSHNIKQLAAAYSYYKQQHISNKAITLFTRWTNDNINSIQSLRHKKLAVPGINQSATWWIFRELLMRSNIDPFHDLRAIRNIVNPLSLVHEVLSGRSDVGVLPAGTLESLSDSKQIDLQTIRIIDSQRHSEFNYKHSSKLYAPDLFIANAKLPTQLLNKVSIALLSMSTNQHSPLKYGWQTISDLDNATKLVTSINSKTLNSDTTGVYSLINNSTVWLIIATVLALILFFIINKYQYISQKYILMQRENRQLLQQQKRLTINDELTELSSRTALDNSLEQEWSRACREKLPVAAIIINIKSYMRLEQQSVLLKTVAQRIRTTFKRAIDIKARYGKNEFVIILPNTNFAESQKLAIRLMHNLHLEINQLTLASDFSIHYGVAALIPKPDSVPEALIAAADQSLAAFNAEQDPQLIKTIH